ncbi:MAG: hypothetical protein HOL51_01460 [Gemmatimonadetes bacterium]|nr:hypothetical protein [Gemmatimonadota bacterium]MBT5324764.1 hypothetical protein [Gemmatimonadota bacterium]MBT5449914.1 hypothetical protein [Gemmatimonadota bacterium]MBT5804985.1 hypothetical protein [Gemmatimonadota bacterium]MBT6623300.1 hypothetical protein [Gemmatimonadota bacterium]
MIQKLLDIDRRIIFVLVFVAVAVPLLAGMVMPITPTKEVQAAYDEIEKRAAGDVVLVSFSYGASTVPEMQPMARAILRHAFRRELKIVAICLWPEATGLAQEVLEDMAAEFELQYGVDYTFMGYKPGNFSVILNMGQDFHSAFPQDNWGAKADELELTRPLRSLKDFDLVFDLAAGDSIEFWWIPYGQEKFGFPFAAGCTAVMAPDLYPFLDSGQLNGLLGGLAGAAEYETLVNHPGKASKGMSAQSFAHLIIVAFVIIGNTAYFVSRRTRPEQRS